MRKQLLVLTMIFLCGSLPFWQYAQGSESSLVSTEFLLTEDYTAPTEGKETINRNYISENSQVNFHGLTEISATHNTNDFEMNGYENDMYYDGNETFNMNYLQSSENTLTPEIETSSTITFNETYKDGGYSSYKTADGVMGQDWVSGMTQDDIEGDFDYIYSGCELEIVDSDTHSDALQITPNTAPNDYIYKSYGSQTTGVFEIWAKATSGDIILLADPGYSYRIRLEWASNQLSLYNYDGGASAVISFSYTTGDWAHVSLEVNGTHAIGTINQTATNKVAFTNTFAQVWLWPDTSALIVDAIGFNQSNDYVVGTNWESDTTVATERKGLLNLTHYNSTDYGRAYGVYEQNLDVGDTSVDLEELTIIGEGEDIEIIDYMGHEKVINSTKISNSVKLNADIEDSANGISEVWFNAPTGMASQIYMLGSNTTGLGVFYIRITSLGRIQIYIYATATSTYSSVDTYTNDEWYHLSVEWGNSEVVASINQTEVVSGVIQSTQVIDIIDLRNEASTGQKTIYWDAWGINTTGYTPGSNYEPYGLVKDYKFNENVYGYDFELGKDATDYDGIESYGSNNTIVNFEGHEKVINLTTNIDNGRIDFEVKSQSYEKEFETWIYYPSESDESSSKMYFFGYTGGSASWYVSVYRSGCIVLYDYDSTNTVISYDGDVKLDEWVHLTIGYNSSHLYCLRNGNLTVAISMSPELITEINTRVRYCPDYIYLDAFVERSSEYLPFSNMVGVGTGAQWNNSQTLSENGDATIWYQSVFGNENMVLLNGLDNCSLSITTNQTWDRLTYQYGSINGSYQIKTFEIWRKMQIYSNGSAIFLKVNDDSYQIPGLSNFNYSSIIYSSYDGSTLYDSIDATNCEDYFEGRTETNEVICPIYNTSMVMVNSGYEIDGVFNETRALKMMDSCNLGGFDFTCVDGTIPSGPNNIEILLEIEVETYETAIFFDFDFKYSSEFTLSIDASKNATVLMLNYYESSVESYLQVYDLEQNLLETISPTTYDTAEGDKMFTISTNSTVLIPTYITMYALDSNILFRANFNTYTYDGSMENIRYEKFNVLDVSNDPYSYGYDEFDLTWDERNTDFTKSMEYFKIMNPITYDLEDWGDLDIEQINATVLSDDRVERVDINVNALNLNNDTSANQIQFNDSNYESNYTAYLFKINITDTTSAQRLKFNNTNVGDDSANRIEFTFFDRVLGIFDDDFELIDLSELNTDFITIIYEVYGELGKLNITFVEIGLTKSWDIILDEENVPGFSATVKVDMYYMGSTVSNESIVHIMKYGYHEVVLAGTLKYSLPDTEEGYELYFGQLQWNTFNASYPLQAETGISYTSHVYVRLYTLYNETTHEEDSDGVFEISALDYAAETVSENYWLEYNLTYRVYSTFEETNHQIQLAGELEWNVWIRYVGMDEGIFGMMLTIIAPFLIFLLFPFMFRNFGKKGSVVGVGLGMVFGFIIMAYTGMLALNQGAILLILSGITLLLMLKKENNNPGNKIIIQS